MMTKVGCTGKHGRRSGSALTEGLGLPAERSALGAPHGTTELQALDVGRPVRGKHCLLEDSPTSLAALPRRGSVVTHRWWKT
jgi:hypothetical protein